MLYIHKKGVTALNRFESKYLDTARLMDEALILLLEDKEFEYVTVKEIWLGRREVRRRKADRIILRRCATVA